MQTRLSLNDVNKLLDSVSSYEKGDVWSEEFERKERERKQLLLLKKEKERVEATRLVTAHRNNAQVDHTVWMNKSLKQELMGRFLFINRVGAQFTPKNVRLAVRHTRVCRDDHTDFGDVILCQLACEQMVGNESQGYHDGDHEEVTHCASEALGEEGMAWLNSGQKLIGGGRNMKKKGPPHSRVLVKPTPFKDAATVATPSDERKVYAVGIPLQTIATAQAALTVGQVSFNMNTMTTFVVGGGALPNIPFYTGDSLKYDFGRVHTSEIVIFITSNMTAGAYKLILYPAKSATGAPGTAAAFQLLQSLPGAVVRTVNVAAAGENVVIAQRWNCANWLGDPHRDNYKTDPGTSFAIGGDPAKLFTWNLAWLNISGAITAGTVALDALIKNGTELFGRIA